MVEAVALECPECGSVRVWRDGTRRDGRQRYQCRECGYRFTAERKKVNAHASITETGKYAASAQPKNLLGLRAMKRQGETTEEATLKGDSTKARQIDFAWQMKKDGYRDTTIKSYGYDLKTLVKHGADLDQPETVKEVLARSSWSPTRKNNVIAAYTLFLKMQGETWKPPICKVTRKLPYIPTEQELDALIAGTGRKTSTFLQLLKETALRASEACRLQWRDVDLQRRIIVFNNPMKNGNPRIFKISSKLVTLLSRLPRSKYVFGTNKKVTRQATFYKTRKKLAGKLDNPNLLRIGFHTFRHWKATTLFHETHNIVLVQQFLGHKRLETTLLYIQLEEALYKTDSDRFTVQATDNLKEIQTLLESGFDFICQKDELMFFRKRK